MYTVSPKTRNSRLYLIVAFATVSIALLSFAAAPSIRLHYAASSGSISNSYDQVELVWAERYMAAGAQQGYLDQRRGEWTAGVSTTPAYLNYRRGEWSGK